MHISSMAKKAKANWAKAPEEHDYPAAESYLSLIFDQRTAAAFVKKLTPAPIVEFKAKDIFRASGLPLLGPDNFHVQADRKKMATGKALSPVLLVRQPKLGRDYRRWISPGLCGVFGGRGRVDPV
jgi:hypothetical protein